MSDVKIVCTWLTSVMAVVLLIVTIRLVSETLDRLDRIEQHLGITETPLETTEPKGKTDG